MALFLTEALFFIFGVTKQVDGSVSNIEAYRWLTKQVLLLVVADRLLNLRFSFF